MLDKLCEQIREELRDGENYAMAALKTKEDYPETAAVYNRLAGEELRHADMLHDQAARMVEREGDETMKAVWQHERRWMVENKADAQRLIDMYKG